MAGSSPRYSLSRIRLRSHRSGGVIKPFTFFLQRVDERLWSGKTRAKAALAIFFFSALSPSLMAGRRAEPFQTPTPQELALNRVPLAPGAPAVILTWARHRDDEGAFEAEHVRIKVLGEEGKKYGDIAIPYIPGYCFVAEIEARTIHADGTIVPFTGKIYDKLVVRSGRRRLMQKTFALPDVQQGSILEYAYILQWSYDRLRSTHWPVQQELPVLRETLWLKPYSGGPYSGYFLHNGLPDGKSPQKVGDHFELDLEHLPAFEKEPYAPPEDQIKPRIDFFYTAGKLDPDRYWKDAAEQWARTIEEFIVDRAEIRRTAVQLIAHAATPDSKLRALYARAQQVRNRSFERDKDGEQALRGLRENKHAEDVLRHGYGYGCEINRLFIAFARVAGFDAIAVRVPHRYEYFSKGIPDADQLDGEIAMVKVNGVPRFFDAETPFAPFGLLSWDSSGVLGMCIQRKGGGNWIAVPDQGASDAVLRRSASLSIDGNLVKGSVHVSFEGQEALVRRLLAFNEDEATSRKLIEDEAKKWFPDGSAVRLTALSGMRGIEETLTADFDVELADVGSLIGSRAIVPLSIFATKRKEPFSAEQRRYPVYFNYRYSVEDRVRLQVPRDYYVESLPHGASINVGAVGYENHVAQDARTIDYRRNLFVETVVISRAGYPALRSFFSRVATADEESVVLRRDRSAPPAVEARRR